MKKVHDKMVEQFSGQNKYFRAIEFQETISVEVIDTVDKLDSALDHLVTQKLLAFDVEFCEVQKQHLIESAKDNWIPYPKIAASV